MTLIITIVTVGGSLAVAVVVIVVILRKLKGTGGAFGGGKAFVGAPIGIGTVVAAERTGLTVNDVPQMIITLDVERPDGPPFRSQAKQMVDYGSIAAIQPGNKLPGNKLPVRYLPDSASGGLVQLATDAPTAQLQEVVDQIQLAKGEISPLQLMIGRQGIPAQAVVLAMQPTGEIRDGRSVARLQLQINPSDSAAFTTTVDKPIPPHAVGLVQPGAMLNVRYLPEYPNEVVIALPAA